MKKALLVLAVLALSLGSCQCSDKPEVGPVEGQAAAEASSPRLV